MSDANSMHYPEADPPKDPRQHDSARTQTSSGRGKLQSYLARMGGFVIDVLSRFWPISKTEDDILRKESKLYR